MAGTPHAKPPLGGGPVSTNGARPRVLLGHSGPVIAGAAQTILDAHGFAVEIAGDSDDVESALGRAAWDALVVDVALPGAPGFELTSVARAAGVKVVILVASVFRRTSYKRRPRRLYGADDYVEIHHLGDHLPNRLRAHLGLRDSQLPAETLREVLSTLNERGDDHLLEQTPRGLATLIVADLLLYNGDRITEADSVEQALAAVAADLEGARDLFGQVRPEVSEGDLIGEAFRELVAGLDGTGDVS
ncbi:osmolarity response regulator [Enhygromyxa salina]|uniref:Osmolarity response regulator n=1 Tax=Enhygromyxa salina TaxID=215803 RepID=A0A2S9YHA6_9BACT|nr:response regulator transcription factor [Enhygromyxa salina]PRQ04396.1 osmolarity response regulator [Enhygromyxa salina]